MGTEILPQFIRDNYEYHEWKHACAVMKHDFPNEWNDLIELLTQFRLTKSSIETPGGGKSPISSAIDSFLYKKGWLEKEFETKIIVDSSSMDSPTHKVDCFKN